MPSFGSTELMLAIDTKNLQKQFKKTSALQGIDLTVPKGELFGLVGPDGAGKTTLMRILCGIMRPSEGSANVFDYDVVKDPESAKKNIGYMSQRFSLYQDLSVEENIHFFENLYKVPKQERETRKQKLLEFSRLGPFKDRLAGKLSGGMKQKLGLSCALIHTPQLLFLDEPTTGVDPISRREFWSLLYDLWKDGVTIVVSTPYMDEAERCSQIALMKGGRIISQGTPANIIAAFPYQIASITSESTYELSTRLRSLPFVKNIHHFGNRLHLYVEDLNAIRQELQNALSGWGLDCSDIKEVRPTLEDVFLSLEQN